MLVPVLLRVLGREDRVAVRSSDPREQSPSLVMSPGETHKRYGFAKPFLHNNSRRHPLHDDRADLVERREDVLG